MKDFKLVNVKEEKGITLVALAITIAVLIILAGITLRAITGDDGIVNQAQTAKDDTQYASWEEQIDVAILDAESKHRNPDLDDVIQELINKGVIDKESQVDDDGNITTNEPTYTISGKLDDYLPFEPGRFANKNEEWYDSEGNKVVVPGGFTILEEAQKVNDGLVIEDKQGNQFVWIPVDINDMAQCSTAGGSCNLELSGGVLRCTTHNSEDIVGKLYATGIGETFGTVNTSYNANSGLREPAIVTGNSSGTGSDYDGSEDNFSILEYKSSTEMLNDLKSQYKEMATSVARNGGFYIGRYELGLEGTTPVSKNASTNSNVTTANASNSNTSRWYGLYKKCKEYTPKDSNSVVSTMTWGSQYDAMMNWMEDNGVTVTSTGPRNTTTVTGSTSSDNIKNV